ncbi:hypothetical protein DFH29DRAFT_937179 [Suillus ampliporus]|nr:hypothetical protein DFH29DRAFT_937179 [Suillus ampliporus]
MSWFSSVLTLLASPPFLWASGLEPPRTHWLPAWLDRQSLYLNPHADIGIFCLFIYELYQWVYLSRYGRSPTLRYTSSFPPSHSYDILAPDRLYKL